MSNLDRAIVDLDRGGPRNFDDARHALLDDIRRGADPRSVVDTVNRIERHPEHAGAQIQLVQDRYGQLDIAPAPYGRPMEPPPPPYEGPRQGITPGEAAVGVLGVLGAAAILHNLTRDDHRPYYPSRR